MSAIEISHLFKTYKGNAKAPAKKALDDVSLSIPKGSLFALLGPNGAGKSTIINIMAGLVVKTSGAVKIWGHDIDNEERLAKSSIGIVPQEINYDPFFTPLQLLDLQAGLYGVPKKQRRSMELLEIMGLKDQANSYTRSLSGGMRRRLMVAKAMVHNPPILVLDEPTAGVDIELRKQLWENVKILNKQGTTILLTTHYLEEAEQLCDKIAIIDQGKIIASEEKEDLLSRIDNKEIRFRLNKEVSKIPSSLERAGLRLEVEGKRTLMICYSPGEYSVQKMIKDVQKSGYEIEDISTEESDLEDVFLQLTSASKAA